jgi:hypothetical protein
MNVTRSVRAMLLTVIAMCTPFLSTGCSGLFHHELRVDPAVVDDVRETVHVLASTEREEYYRNETIVKQELFIDVGGDNTQQALQAASELLSRRGWQIVGVPESEYMVMKLHKSTDTSASLYGLKFVESTGGLEPEETKALAEAKAKSHSQELILLTLEAG